MDLKGKSFLKLLDFTSEEIEGLLDLAADLKEKKKSGTPHKYYEGKNIALIFEKTSTRTRCAFEVAAADLGMHPTYLDPTGSKYASVPVWNGLTNEFHPTQILADFLTIREHFGELKGKKLVYMGDARYNMGNSLMVGCAKMGMHFVACTNKKYFPDSELVNKCLEIAKETGAVIEFSESTDAVKGAHVIYTDVWVSMGEPDSVWEERIQDLMPYQVNKALMDKAGEQCRFMHCLPAFHNLDTKIGKEIYDKFGIDCMEVTEEVFESEQSIVFDEAENRMHTIKAVIAATI